VHPEVLRGDWMAMVLALRARLVTRPLSHLRDCETHFTDAAAPLKQLATVSYRAAGSFASAQDSESLSAGATDSLIPLD
jgi:hypothetical protein